MKIEYGKNNRKKENRMMETAQFTVMTLELLRSHYVVRV
jgi:hypothetical protein